MLKFVSALLIGILSASLAVIYQNDIASFLGRAPVTANVTVGGWYPHPQKPVADQMFTANDPQFISDYSDPKSYNFARIIVSNNTGKDISSSFIRIGDAADVWKFDAVILRKHGSDVDRTFVENASDKIDMGPLPAAQDTVIYLWTNRGFSYPFSFDDLEILTADGNVHKYVTRVSLGSDEIIFGITSQTVAWIFVFLLLIICVVLLVALSHGFSFAKSMLRDEDYYLAERVRFDASPEKYSVPGTLPKE